VTFKIHPAFAEEGTLVRVVQARTALSFDEIVNRLQKSYPLPPGSRPVLHGTRYIRSDSDLSQYVNS
jgi:hypothetical protein